MLLMLIITADGRKSALKGEEEPSLYTALNSFKGCSKAILPGHYVVAVQNNASAPVYRSASSSISSSSSSSYSIAAVTATSDLQSVSANPCLLITFPPHYFCTMWLYVVYSFFYLYRRLKV